jgi:hypothetical protein
MLERLIQVTNSDLFIQNGHIAIKEVIVRQREFDLKINFEIQDIITETVQYDCEIFCEGIAYTTSNRLHEFKRPYNRINIYQDHPVLWNYGSAIYLTLKGQHVNIAELLGDRFLVHDYACGNRVDFHCLFSHIPNTLTSKDGATIEVPKQLKDTYKFVFDKHKVSYSIDDTRVEKNRFSVLLFGNPEISPDNYNFGQPYIVAEKFTEKLKVVNKDLLQ